MNKVIKVLFALVMIVTVVIPASAQKSITGSLTSGEEPLVSASVLAMKASDSTLVSFALSDVVGKFEVANLTPEKYLIQINFLGFEQYNKIVDLTEVESLDLGTIKMSLAKNQLQEVVIEGETTPIKVVKDTLEYNAAAFETRPQDVVEDLLRQMPGVEVEDDGTIIAQGEEVQNVRVDGKEFFDGDPKVATKNISAEAVKSVQFFDAKSDMSEFTGVDDGEREKTMNLKLKEGYKSGYFGNVGIAGGTDSRYKTDLNINRFGPKSQLSLIGNLNNVNNQGFSVDQVINFMNSSGGFGRRGQSNLPISRGLSDGFVETAALGLNINYDPTSKTDINVSYFLSDIENVVDKISTRENFFGNQENLITNQESQQLTNATNHNIRIRIDQEIDSTQDVRLESRLAFGRNDLLSDVLNNSIANSEVQNTNITDYNNLGSNSDVNGSLMYRKKLSKTANRSLTLRGSLNDISSDLDAELETETAYFPNDPILTRTENIIQNQLDINDAITYNVRASYVEPLSASSYLELEYRRRNYDNEVIRDVFDILNGVQEVNTNLSNHFDRNFVFDRYGLSYHWNGESSSFSLDGMVQDSRLVGNIISDGSVITNDNFAFLPSMQWRRSLGSGKNFRLQYTTDINAPSLEQLQPILDNSDPLNLYQGNPDLIPEYRHNVRFNMISFDQFNFTSLFAFINASYTRNNIINQTTINDRFQQITTPVNTDYAFNVSGNISYGRPIRPLKMKIRLNTNLTYARNILFINETENTSNRYVTRVGITLENRKKTTVDIRGSVNFNYNTTSYDINNDRNLSFFNQTYRGELRLNPNDKWSFDTDLNLRVFDEQDFGESRTVPIWQAGIAYNFLKDNRGELRLSIFDILNQNLGVNRTSNLNFIQNEEIISLGRYTMLSFKYALKSSGGGAGQPRIRMRGR